MILLGEAPLCPTGLFLFCAAEPRAAGNYLEFRVHFCRSRNCSSQQREDAISTGWLLLYLAAQPYDMLMFLEYQLVLRLLWVFKLSENVSLSSMWLGISL